MENDIKRLVDMVDSLEIFHEPKPSKSTRTLLHERQFGGRIPLNKIGMDLFKINERVYLVVIGYFSNITEVDDLSITTSNQVLQCNNT